MFKLPLMLFIVQLICTNTEDFFPLLEQRYCDKNCRLSFNNYVQHVGCNCENTKPIEGLTAVDSDIKFRQAILDKLNDFRNKIAEGSIAGFPSANNMLGLNYDVGLEYSAWCAAKINALSTKQRPCVRNKREGGVWHFATMRPQKTFVNITDPQVALNYLQEHLDLINELSYEKIKNKDKIVSKPHYFKVASLTYNMFNKVGCSRYVQPNIKLVNARYVVICMLGNLYGPQTEFFARIPYYTSGAKCSDCPLKKFYEEGQMKCDQKYQALCGEIKPVPTYKWKDGTIPDEPWLKKQWYTIAVNKSV